MSQSLLAIKAEAANQGGYRVVASTATQLGASTGITAEATPSANGRLCNKHVQIGAQTLFMFIGSEIFKSIDGGATWTSIYTLPQGRWSSATATGLHVIENNGSPIICAMFNSSGSNVYGLKSLDLGATWVTVNLGSLDGQGPWTGEGVFQNRLFMTATQHVGHFIYDPVTDTFERMASGPPGASVGTMGSAGTDFTGFNGKFYRLAQLSTGNGATQGLNLWRYVAGTWQDLGQLAHFNDLAINYDNNHPALFDGLDGFLYAVWWNDRTSTTTYGLQCTKITINPTTGAATFSDVTNPVIPAALRSGITGQGGSANVIFDQETAPDGAVQILLYTKAAQAQTWTQFLFNGPAAEMTEQGTGLAATIILPHNNYKGGGERIFTPGSDFIVKEKGARSRITGGMRLGFTIAGPLGNETVSCAFYREVDGSPSRTRATLANPSVGAYDVPTKQINNIGPADGTTTFFVDFMGVADGVPANSRVKLVGRAF